MAIMTAKDCSFIFLILNDTNHPDYSNFSIKEDVVVDRDVRCKMSRPPYHIK